MMILPLAAIALLWFLMSRTGTAAQLMRRIKGGLPDKLLSIALVAAALLVLARGNAWAALCLFGVSLWLLGRAATRAPGRAREEKARSRLIEMAFDTATGSMRGRIIAGARDGTDIDALDLGQCLALLELCRESDPDGVRLLEPYLDRRFPRWRPAEDVDADPRERRARFTSRMSEDEAYEVLGLRRGASRDEVVRSHRTVMKKWHPDQGGTADLAARANEAKEVLLRRHA